MICMALMFLLALVQIEEVKKFAWYKNFTISNFNGVYFVFVYDIVQYGVIPVKNS